MENKRAGFSFKAVGVVGFVLLTFLLIRVLRLPNGTIPSDMLPNFLMLLLGILVLASSFILLALGRIVELLQSFNSSKALLNEIRDETERIRIESQYIYEVQKDTLVKLTNVDETPVVDPYIEHQNRVANQVGNLVDTSEANDLLSTDTSTSNIDNMAKTGVASKGASYAASRLTKNIDKNKLSSQETSALKTSSYKDEEVEHQVELQSPQSNNFESASNSDSEKLAADIKANTDESTWSTLTNTSANTSANTETDLNSDSNVGGIEARAEEKSGLIFDKVANLPVAESEYDAAALDGSDDIVDDLPQSNVWKPVPEDELRAKDVSFNKGLDSEEISGKIQDKVVEVEEAEVNASLEEAVDKLEPIKPQSSTAMQTPAYSDRLSQTEKTPDNVSNVSEKLQAESAVRFGTFPESNVVSETQELDSTESKASFTLEDITDEDFSETSDYSSSDYSENKSSVSTVQDADKLEDDVESLAEVFSNTSKSSNTNQSTFPTKGFNTKGFNTVDDSFENAEDSFDDIREVFDTKAKKLTSGLSNLTNTPKGEDRIKDSLKRVSDKISDEASGIGKNLN